MAMITRLLFVNEILSAKHPLVLFGHRVTSRRKTHRIPFAANRPVSSPDENDGYVSGLWVEFSIQAGAIIGAKEEEMFGSFLAPVHAGAFHP